MTSTDYSLKNDDYPRLLLFTRKGPAVSTALLIKFSTLCRLCFCSCLTSFSTWRIDYMADLASSVYAASSAALGRACAALSAQHISRNLLRLTCQPDCGYPVHRRDRRYLRGVSEAGEEGKGFWGVLARCLRCLQLGVLINHCNLISKPKSTDRRKGRAAGDIVSNQGAMVHLNRIGAA